MSQKEVEKTWIDSLKAGVQRAAGEIGHELKQKVAQGAHELAAALFQGNAFVMYTRAQKVPTQDQTKSLEQDQAPQRGQPELDRGGRSR